jgi:hypothetical protein
MTDDDWTLEDDNESFADGDSNPEDIDWEKVAQIQARIDEAQALTGDERNMANLALLSELHGNDLELI